MCDISIGSYKFGNCEPKVTITHSSKDGETSSKALPFSHASFRRLASLPNAYNWQEEHPECMSPVGDQGFVQNSNSISFVNSITIYIALVNVQY